MEVQARVDTSNNYPKKTSQAKVFYSRPFLPFTTRSRPFTTHSHRLIIPQIFGSLQKSQTAFTPILWTHKYQICKRNP